MVTNGKSPTRMYFRTLNKRSESTRLTCAGSPYGGEVEDMYSSDYSDTYSDTAEEKPLTDTPRSHLLDILIKGKL